MNYCIALGDGAQANDCDYQLSIGANGGQYSTVMTPKEWEVVNRVVRRAVEGGFKWHERKPEPSERTNCSGPGVVIGYQAPQVTGFVRLPEKKDS